MSEVSPAEIAVLTTEVRHLTDAVKRLLVIVDEQRASLEKKADADSLIRAEKDIMVLFERENNCKVHDTEMKQRMQEVETRLSKLEMEAWKLGMMLGGSATGGGALALIGQYLVHILM
jgi:methylphosphotriester-DNA--protein-cysteine methyltransferase